MAMCGAVQHLFHMVWNMVDQRLSLQTSLVAATPDARLG
jgi:hypothetical protein